MVLIEPYAVFLSPLPSYLSIKMTSWSYGSSENHRNERPVALICMISCQILLGHWPMNYDIRIGNYRRIMLAVSKQYEANIIMFADIFFFVEIMVLVDT